MVDLKKSLIISFIYVITVNLRLNDCKKKRLTIHDKIFIKIPQWQGSAITLQVNNSGEINCTFSTKEIEISNFLDFESDNILQVTIYGHRRNAMGPFYLKESNPTWTDSKALRTVEQRERNLVPLGLMQPLELSIKKE
jgi:hypothetical protein